MQLEVSSLTPDGSPRLEGENVMHARVLAEVGEGLPPILVHRETRRVIDGVHRVRAAVLRGERTIEAILFDGDLRAAFVEGVRANVTHGLPLSLADRRAAAGRIIAFYPEWSDRAVAALVCLSPNTVRVIRRRTNGQVAQSDVRIGKDGRLRPTSFADGRLRAAKVLAERPEASVREIARTAGVSLGTASDVRTRLANGESPLPDGMRNLPTNGAARKAPRPRHSRCGREPAALLTMLSNDPSLRYSETGRNLVRWLGLRIVHPGRWSPVVDALPPHLTYVLAELARSCARVWDELAEELGRAHAAATRRSEGTTGALHSEVVERR